MNDFNWLPNSVKKQVPFYPVIEIIQTDDVSGMYYHPYEDYPKGLVQISENCTTDSEGYASTLAHEFRHHWQLFNFGWNNNRVCWFNLISKYDYDEAIRLYFEKNPDERDALLFENKVVGTDNTRYWIQHILKWKI